VEFNSASYGGSEFDGSAKVTAWRLGDPTFEATVDYQTEDGTASQRKDYTLSAGKLTFAPGESVKSFVIPIIDNEYVDGLRTLKVKLTNPIGAVLGTMDTADVTISDDDFGTSGFNPLDDHGFFVRQHYYDFLSRLPDQEGLTYWVGQIAQCQGAPVCTNNRRIDVSNAFFFEQEYQQTGAYVFRLYRTAFGNNQPFPNSVPDPANPGEEKKLVSYQTFAIDRARVVGGTSLANSQLDLANAFVQRPEFLAKYDAGLNGPAFVDALLATLLNDMGVDLGPQRQALIDLFNAGGRGAVLYRLADDNVQTNPIDNRGFIDAEYNRAFVATQYFGYLRRDPDMGGFLFWLGQVNNAPLRDVPKQHAMVCSFITSIEYQQRFSSIVTHTNAECQ
jgi:hypothetical protein